MLKMNSLYLKLNGGSELHGRPVSGFFSWLCLVVSYFLWFV